MEIEFTLTPDDAAAFQRYHFKTSHTSRRYYLIRFIYGTLASVLLFVVFSGWKNVWGILGVLVFWLVYLLMIPLSTRLNINAFVKRLKKEGKNTALWGRHRITINEQELLASSEVEESHLRWAGIERVTENDDYIFIYVTTVSAHVIPKKFFSDPTQAQLFYQTAQKYFDNAHQMAG
jgi:hypothetical protein